MRILVTGGAGFVGSNLVDRLMAMVSGKGEGIRPSWIKSKPPD
jgi:nucleoside-diphosphate-sugar epimerase